MLDIKLSRKKTILTLFFISIFGLILRLLYFKNITFGYDQARDAFEALNIWLKDPIKIIGPGTDFPGLHHGPLYWYLLSPIYYFTKGSVVGVRMFLILLHSLNIFIVYFLTKKLFKNKQMALLSSFFFAVSFEAIQYSRWLSNPTPALLTIPFFFYGLWLLINNKPIGLPLMLFTLAISIHFQLFLAYQLLFLIIAVIYTLIKKQKLTIINKKSLSLYLGSFIFIAPFILSEIKFKFQGTKAIISYLINHNSNSKNLIDILIIFFNRLTDHFYNNIFSSIIFAKIAILAITIWSLYYIINKKKFFKEILLIYIWFISPFIIYPFSPINSYFLTIGNIYPLIILVSFIIWEVSKLFNNKLISYTLIGLFLTIVVKSNFQLIFKYNQNGETLFSVQKRMILRDELKVVNWIYKRNKNSRFAINTVTNPLFINTTWSYLFNWYGKNKYGYMPIWLGYPQDGVYGSDVKFSNKDIQVKDNLYLIIEPGPGIPESYIKGYSKFEDTRSKLVEIKKIGNFTIEKRQITQLNPFSRDELVKIITKEKL